MATAQSRIELSEPAATAAGRPVRVLHVINGEHYAGAERVQDLLAARLPELGFQIDFACLKPRLFPELRRSTGATVYDVGMTSRLSLGAAWRVAEIVERGPYALLHTHTARSALVGRLAAALTGVPMVHHLHSPATADTAHPVRNWLNATSERFSLRHAAALVAVSQSLAEHARQQRLSTRPVRVVPNGVPLRGPLVVRPRPTPPWRLGTVALFRPRKGLEVLLDAVAALLEQGLSLRLQAVGTFETSEYEHAVRRRVDELGIRSAVEWRGFQSDVDRELAGMDLFVLPSLFGEGLPMVVLEAMAAGVPVVATRVAGVPEAIRHGLDGLIAEPGSAVELAAMIRRVLEGDADWSSMRSSAHQRQREMFSDERMAHDVARLYREILHADS
ncbi:MAG TPA: glycosyltransferase [Pirellulales bacterium]